MSNWGWNEEELPPPDGLASEGANYTVFGSMQRMFDEAKLDPPTEYDTWERWMIVDGVRYEGEAMVKKLKEMAR